MGDEYLPSAVLILQHFLTRLGEPTPGAPPPTDAARSKLLAVTRSLVTHRMRVPPSGREQRAAHQAALLHDLSVAARRVEQEGLAAVCDDLAHAEWLSDTAWNLGCATIAPAGGGDEAADAQPVDMGACAGFISSCYELSLALPVSERRLQQQVACQCLISKCELHLVHLMPAEQQQSTAAQQHLQKASQAIQLAFRLQQRSAQVVAMEGGVGLAPDLVPMLQLLNVELALRRGESMSNLQQARASAQRERRGHGSPRPSWQQHGPRTAPGRSLWRRDPAVSRASLPLAGAAARDHRIRSAPVASCSTGWRRRPASAPRTSSSWPSAASSCETASSRAAPSSRSIERAWGGVGASLLPRKRAAT